MKQDRNTNKFWEEFFEEYEENPEFFTLPQTLIKNPKIKKARFDDVLDKAVELLEELQGGE